MTTHVYSIRALTNLHVGSGDAGYGIVDKLVQRDPTTKLPTIHASGIKGALRQRLEELKDEQLSPLIRRIFGSSVKENADKIKQGEVRFLNADLLALPVPYEGTDPRRPFDLVTTLNVTGEFDDKVSLFTDWDNWAGTQVQSGVWESDAQAFARTAHALPVVARNYLNDGASENLWYEEFVPREAVFATSIQGPDTLLQTLKSHLHDQIVQLGANATVGYGYCLFTLLNDQA